jgi:hypothetical protein
MKYYGMAQNAGETRRFHSPRSLLRWWIFLLRRLGRALYAKKSRLMGSCEPSVRCSLHGIKMRKSAFLFNFAPKRDKLPAPRYPETAEKTMPFRNSQAGQNRARGIGVGLSAPR